jgi:chemotaxis signal transduction protein
MMIETASKMAQRAAELRRAFDHSFANPPSAEEAVKQDLLAIRVAGQHFALRLSDISGLYTDKKITPVPGAAQFLLGMAGFRGAIAPIYDLQRFLGYPAGPAPRWLVVAAAAPVGFAFAAFDGRLRIAAAAVMPQQQHDKEGLTSGVINTDGVLRPIVEISRVLKVIQT